MTIPKHICEHNNIEVGDLLDVKGCSSGSFRVETEQEDEEQ
jgi:hypothetical protein